MKIDHLGLAVRSIEESRRAWEPALGTPAAPPELVESQGVRVAFLEVGGSHLELLEPVRPDSAVGRFLEQRGEGMHHVAFHVDSVAEALRSAEARGQRLIDRAPRPGARGRRVGFVHPAGFHGVLVEFAGGSVSVVASVALSRIYDSRGQETVEATVRLADGSEGRAGAPSGASTGSHEVQAFPSGGVSAVLQGAEGPLRGALVGAGELDQAAFDARLHQVDGTPTFSRIGGNTATALSVAFALAEARASGQSLAERLQRPGHSRSMPAIVGNCLNGGRHAIGGPEFQEFIAFAPSDDPARSVAAALAVHKAVGAALHAKFPEAALGRGDEGGWVAAVNVPEAMEILSEACHSVSDRLGTPVHPGLDLAASEFFRDGRYVYRDRKLDPEAQVSFVAELVDRFGIRYLEDPCDEDAFDSFAALTAAVGKKTLLVGDDIYTTRAELLQKGLDRKASNAILIKVNQVGTLTDTLRTVDLAGAHGWKTVTSHRSGDLPEGWLAQLAVGTGAVGLKCGLLGGERVAKLNELLRVGAATGADHR